MAQAINVTVNDHRQTMQSEIQKRKDKRAEEEKRLLVLPNNKAQEIEEAKQRRKEERQRWKDDYYKQLDYQREDSARLQETQRQMQIEQQQLRAAYGDNYN